MVHGPAATGHAPHQDRQQQNSRRATTCLDVELFDGDGARLAHAEGAANGLVLQGRVHGRLQDEHMVGRSQIDAHRTAAHAQQEHRSRRIPLERVDRLQQRFTCASAGEQFARPSS